MAHCVETFFWCFTLWWGQDEMSDKDSYIIVQYLQNSSSDTYFTEGSFPFPYSCDHLYRNIRQGVLRAPCKLGSISLWPEAVFSSMAVSGTWQQKGGCCCSLSVPSPFPPLLTILQQLLFEGFVGFFGVGLKIFLLQQQHCMFHSHSKWNRTVPGHGLGCLPRQISAGSIKHVLATLLFCKTMACFCMTMAKGMIKLSRPCLTNQVFYRDTECVCFIGIYNS